METISKEKLYAEIIRETFSISAGNNAEITETHIARFEKIGKWLSCPKKGWLFLGNPGSGKTTLLESITRIMRNNSSIHIAHQISEKFTAPLTETLRKKFKDYYTNGSYDFKGNEDAENKWYEENEIINNKQSEISKQIRECFQNKGNEMIFTTSRDICLFANRKGRDAMLETIGNIPVLIIDDLGNAAEPKSVKFYGKNDDGNILNEEIFPIIELIEYRYENPEGITIIASNLDIPKLTERYGEPVMDRISEMCYRGLWEFDSYRRKFAQSPNEEVLIRHGVSYDNLLTGEKGIKSDYDIKGYQ